MVGTFYTISKTSSKIITYDLLRMNYYIIFMTQLHPSIISGILLHI